MAAAVTTALTIVATTTLAASNTHDIQLMGKDDSWVSSFTHTPINWTGNVGSDDFGGFNSAQYGWSHPHQHHGSTDMIADFNGDNSNSTAGSADRGGFNSAQYGWSHLHQHHGSTDMIADFNVDNSTAGSADPGGFAQYGSGSHSHHHQNDAANSSWMWPTHHGASDIVDLN